MRHRLPIALVLTALAAALGTRGVLAQIEGGDRGVAAVDSSNDFEVAGIRVDVSGPNADAARLAGWREAQRKAYTLLSQRMGAGAGTLPDGTLDSIVSSIVVENEQIGPNRYVARLGVLFDRGRTAGLLGVSAAVSRSSPFLVVPVQWSTGVGTVFEQRTLWQEAWARFRTGSSAIDYVRPTGTGPDSLLLDVGQTQRPDRGWWRTLIDQYGASDVLMPTVRLYRQWPGGPVIGVFEARYGPDHRVLQRFSLRVGTTAGVPALLDEGVKRLDGVYQRALREGYLGLDPGLNPIMPVTETPPEEVADLLADDPTLAPAALAVTIQYDTPDVGAVTGAESALRSVPGVTSAATTSLALGGVSSMNVSYAGTTEALRAALEARGWQVIGNGTTLRIRRATPTPSPSPRTGAAT
ncbi:MAG: heavy-metal-associated domain-containing protein [Sphingomonas phyllosphaerae]|uniref:heavy-metal-associated domain-containing protein n=1 Tax=Sphingomonas phyllosphaerae TaxID=257003 RepID=UPI002FF652A7